MPVFRPDPPAKVVVGTGQDGCRSSYLLKSVLHNQNRHPLPRRHQLHRLPSLIQNGQCAVSLSWSSAQPLTAVFCTASDRPPTMSRTLANKSLKMFIPKAHSAVTFSMRLMIGRFGAVSVVSRTASIYASLTALASIWVKASGLALAKNAQVVQSPPLPASRNPNFLPQSSQLAICQPLVICGQPSD